MPPVLGPVSPSPTRLKSCADASGTTRVPSVTQSSETSGPDEALLDHDGAPGLAEGRARQLRLDVGRRLVVRVGDEHALARGQPVGLHDVGRRERAKEVERGALLAPTLKRAKPAVGTPAATSSSFIHAFEPSRRAPSAPGPKTSAPRPRRRSANPSTSGTSGPMT